MDILALVASNLMHPRPARPNTEAEDRYYREHAGITLLSPDALATRPALLSRLLALEADTLACLARGRNGPFRRRPSGSHEMNDEECDKAAILAVLKSETDA